ncbi:unnamed protein product [Tilletia laevis]|nr:hypothetical protein CF336_g3554 [Tilletia laevis]KAE8199829.1 hypothetical protein CF328_g3132 [Tilletia controversa]KAE8262009.1 hypothetical protein A4X03_0g2790 [Tilletia caries]CAD6929246.1 unnamed protein product [Tilletia laevis]CAD6959221.1 unnamed protein product [Tilletia controversa]
MVSFQLSDASPHQAKAQATASTAAALSSPTVAASSDWTGGSQWTPASAPVRSSHHHSASQGDASAMPTSCPTETDDDAHTIEWGLHHDDLHAYPCLPEQGHLHSSGSDNAVDSDFTTPSPQSSPFKKAASWCSARGASMPFISTSIQSIASAAETASRAPIRLVTAAQFARMQEAYSAQDVPHHVVFPFLHGVDGDIPAQNVFFGAPLGGQPTPRYRGLTVVRADMPKPGVASEHDQAQRHGSKMPLSGFPTAATSYFADGVDPFASADTEFEHGRPKSNSSCDSDGSDDSSGPSSDDSSSMERSMHERESSNSMYEHFAANLSMASSNTTTLSHSSGQSFFEDKIAGQSFQSDTTSGFSMSGDGPDEKPRKILERFNGGSNAHTPQCEDADCSSSSMPDVCAPMVSRPYEAQPSHSILNSTLFANELLSIPEPEEDRVRPRSSTSASDPPSPSKFSSSSSYKRLSAGAALSSSPTSSSVAGVNEHGTSRQRGKATFVHPRQAAGVSLRNFRIQAVKYATISDIVIYSPAGLHAGAVELAKDFRDAQEAMLRDRQERGLGGLQYNVFIVTDSFDVFERQFDHLVAVDSQGFQHHSVAFLDREREEMQRLTRCSEIEKNVWLGCSRDIPPLEPGEEEMMGVDDKSNPHGFSFCVEAHEMAFMPGDETLRRASSFLETLERMSSESQASNSYESGAGQGYFDSFEGAQSRASQPHAAGSPSASPTTSVIHLECASSSQGCSNSESLNRMADDIIEFCAWIKNHACPEPTNDAGAGAAVRPRKFLIHCGDGYTETSIMGLSYLMFTRQLSLPEAYLDLQHRADRSFFLYGRDLPLLKRVDDKLAGLRRMSRQAEEEAKMRAQMNHRPKTKHSFPWLSSAAEEQKPMHGRLHSASECTPSAEPSSWAKSLAAAATGLVSPNASSSQSHHRKALSFASATPSMLSRHHRNKQSSVASAQSMIQPEDTTNQHAWFHHPRFEGSFPSRILPFVYLGNLNHAMNADMLHALGITHVVSVGESALHPPAEMYYGGGDYNCDSASRSVVHSESALWRETQAGRISVLDLKNVSDDGIDSLRDTMRQSVEYIENARRSGGKVLVHCRVGVSRSATIVLAYAMAHLDLGLVEAYLLVRSRRLNILIQPHLLFFWELRGWEHYLAEQKDRQAAGETTPGCMPAQLSTPDCSEIDYKDVDEEMTDADADPHQLPCHGPEADERAFSMAALSLCSFTPAVRPLATFPVSPHVSPSMESSMATPTVTAEQQQQQGADLPLDVDLAAGAGTIYGRTIVAPETLQFGSGSPSGTPYKSLRLTWGFFCREIAALNERYCV